MLGPSIRLSLAFRRRTKPSLRVFLASVKTSRRVCYACDNALSPSVARDWVILIVNGVNNAVRARDVEEAENSIAFLNEQRQKTSLVSLTEVFAELIEQQTKTVMLAAASEEYVFQVIDPPVAPELKSEPSRALICIIGRASWRHARGCLCADQALREIGWAEIVLLRVIETH